MSLQDALMGFVFAKVINTGLQICSQMGREMKSISEAVSKIENEIDLFSRKSKYIVFVIGSQLWKLHAQNLSLTVCGAGFSRIFLELNLKFVF